MINDSVGAGRLSKLAPRLVLDRGGNVAMMFSLSLLVLLGAVGASVDYGRSFKAKSQVDSMLDSAVLAAAVEVRNGGAADLARAESVARREFARVFEANGGGAFNVEFDVGVARVGTETHVTANYVGGLPTTFAKLLGVDRLNYSGEATAIASGFPFIDVTLLVDTSASMALGATAGDISRLQSKFGCAFACHDNPGSDSYSWAKANGVKLRYDLVHDAILSFADFIENHSEGSRVRVQLYAFDDTLRRLSPLNASMKNLRKNLPSTPVTSSTTAGGTRWWEYANDIPKAIKKSGDGSTRGKARQLVLILTDGVQDPNRTWTSNVPLRAYVREFAWAACDAVRAKDAMVGVVQVPYLRLTWDWGYNVTLNEPSMLGRAGMKRIDDVDHALRQCGGDLFMTAESPDEVARSFEFLFKKAVPIRLAR